MRFGLWCIMLLCGAGAWASEDPVRTADWMRQRELLRKQRSPYEQGAEDGRQARAERGAKIVADLLLKAKDQGVGRDDAGLRDLIAGIRYQYAPAALSLAGGLAALPEHAAVDPKQAKAWSQLLEARRKVVLQPTEKLFLDTLHDAPELAHDCVEEALVLWPDHRDLRRNLGQVRVGERWYGPREAELAKSGLVWDGRFGWIIEHERARYEQGEYYDLETKAWSSLADADERHSQPATRWVVLTEHLEVRGTAKLVDLVDTANRLETFYDRIFAAYAGFFVRGGTIGNSKRQSEPELKLLFGMLDHPRLVINVARDQAGYRASLPPGVDPGWSAGMFISHTRECYFYAGYTAAVYHEFTHQILHLFTGGNRAPAWLVEGAAVYAQAPVFRDGRMELGVITGNHHISSYFEQLAQGKAMPLERVLQLEDGAAWTRSPNPDLNYPGAGAVVQYCMEADERRHRSDFIDYLRDAYQGQTRGYHLWDYLGMDNEALTRGFTLWAGDQQAGDQRAINPPPAGK